MPQGASPLNGIPPGSGCPRRPGGVRLPRYRVSRRKGEPVFIRSLMIERLRGLEKLEWRPRSRVNCLIGPGDAGKSAVLSAIELVPDPRPSPTTSEYDYFRRRVEDGFQICGARRPRCGFGVCHAYPTAARVAGRDAATAPRRERCRGRARGPSRGLAATDNALGRITLDDGQSTLNPATVPAAAGLVYLSRSPRGRRSSARPALCAGEGTRCGMGERVIRKLTGVSIR